MVANGEGGVGITMPWVEKWRQRLRVMPLLGWLQENHAPHNCRGEIEVALLTSPITWVGRCVPTCDLASELAARVYRPVQW